jgi:hypothetical protein
MNFGKICTWWLLYPQDKRPPDYIGEEAGRAADTVFMLGRTETYLGYASSAVLQPLDSLHTY